MAATMVNRPTTRGAIRARSRRSSARPDFTRRGIGREIVRLSEEAARAAGYATIEIVATLAGEPLYAACGYAVTERYEIPLGNGMKLPVVRMRK
jgi:predicted N-acetyltransferase YhbS